MTKEVTKEGTKNKLFSSRRDQAVVVRQLMFSFIMPGNDGIYPSSANKWIRNREVGRTDGPGEGDVRRREENRLPEVKPHSYEEIRIGGDG